MSGLPERVAALFSASGTPQQESHFEERESLYAPDMRFADPIQELTSRDEFLEMMRRLYTRATSVRFEDVSVVGDDAHFFMSWRMRLRMKVGPEFSAHGMSEFHARDGRIVSQRDCRDLLGTFMGSLPLAGQVWRRAVRTLLG